MSLGCEAIVANVMVAILLGTIAWSVLRVGRRPALAHAVFLLAMLKLVTPPLLPLPGLSWPATAVMATPGLPTAVAPTAATIPPRAFAPVAPDLPTMAGPAVQQPVAPASPAALERTVLLVWGGGSLLVLCILWRRTRRFAAATRALLPAPEPWLAEVRALLPRLGLCRAPIVHVVDAEVPPTVFLSRCRARMLLPSRCLDELPPLAVRALLVHELAHLRRRDPWVRVFETAMTVLWWWLPVLWWLRHGLRDAEERSCDAWVAAVLPDARQAYCSALLLVAASDPALPVPAFASATRRIRNWKSRLEDVMCREIPHRTSVTARLSILLLAVMALPLALPARAQNEAAPPDVATRLATVVEAAIDAASLDEWTQWLTTATKVPFTIDASARKVDPEHTSLRRVHLSPMPANRLLNVIAAMTDLQWHAGPASVVIDGPTGSTVSYVSDGQGPHCFVFGASPKRGMMPLETDDSIFKLLGRCGWSSEANLGRMILIRPDSKAPLTFEVGMQQLVGDARANGDMKLQDGDILYLPKGGETAALPPIQLAVGSRLEFLLYFDATQRDCEQLRHLFEPQTVGRDGTILVPYVGHVQVLGLTQEGVEALVRNLLRPLFRFEIELHARFLP